MDRGKRQDSFLDARNSRMYMDLKDIIREHALIFLPAKSLFRFMAVCRDWKLKISSPFFAHKQSLDIRGPSGLFLQTPGGSPSFIAIDHSSCGVPDPLMRFLPEPVDIMSSSNGLLCCQGRDEDKAYYICNPATKQWKILPKPNANHGSDPAVVLLCELSLLNFIAEYKIICAFPSTDFDDATEFDIYSSREGSWVTAGEIFFGTSKVVSRSGFHVNGVVYWDATEGSILAFDLTKERSQLITGHKNCEILGAFNRKLCMAHCIRCEIKIQSLVNVYSNTMEIGSNAIMWEEIEWILPDSKAIGADAGFNYSVLYIGDDLIVVQSGNSIYSFDLNSQEIIALGRTAEFYSGMRCLSYVNSLVSL